MVLSEELIEVALGAAQIVSKSLRFGPDDRNVLDPEGPTNQERLVVELNDLMGVIELCVDHGLIPGDWEKGSLKMGKRKKVLAFMEYARKQGALQIPGDYTPSSYDKRDVGQ